MNFDMIRLTPKSIRTKVAFLAGVCLLFMAATIIVYYAISIKRITEEIRKVEIAEAQNHAEAVAKQFANHIRGELEEALGSNEIQVTETEKEVRKKLRG